jgi:hypothetical protein
MAGNGERRDRRRGHRWLIAASFAGQAALIAVAAAGSAHSTSSAVSVSAVPAPDVPAPLAAVPSAAVPSAPVPAPAVPLPPGEIGVTVSAAGQSGDIGFPAPEDPPRLVIAPGADAAITVDLAIPPGAQVRGLWLGIAADQWTGALDVQRVLLTSMDTPLGPGRYTYVLHWAMPAGTPAGRGNLLVLDVQHAKGADQAPIAELVAG